MTRCKGRYRIGQIVQDGQGWIALIDGSKVVARFTNWTDAKAAYRKALAEEAAQ